MNIQTLNHKIYFLYLKKKFKFNNKIKYKIMEKYVKLQKAKMSLNNKIKLNFQN